MAPKKAAGTGKRKKKEMILLEVKKEIIRKHEEGRRVTDLAKEYGKNTSTIASILKMKERINGRDAAKGVTVITKHRPPVLEEVEKLLLLWIEEKQRAGDKVTEAAICAKAKALHADLLGQQPGTSADSEVFKASRGWFEKFKNRSGIRGKRNLHVAWHDLWPDCVVVTPGADASAPAPESTVLEDIVSLGRTMGLEVTEEEVCRLVEGRARGLATKDLMDLQQEAMEEQKFSLEEEEEQQQQQQEEEEEETKEEYQSPMDPKKACQMWAELQAFVRLHHPRRAEAQKVLDSFESVVMAPLRGMLKRRPSQQTIDKFLVKLPRREEEPSGVRDAGLPSSTPSSRK